MPLIQLLFIRRSIIGRPTSGELLFILLSNVSIPRVNYYFFGCPYLEWITIYLAAHTSGEILFVQWLQIYTLLIKTSDFCGYDWLAMKFKW